jgi:hypothetical protein
MCRLDNKLLQISLIEPFIREISIKVLQQIILELFPVWEVEVGHAFNSLPDFGRAVLEDRVDLLIVINNIMEGTEAFIVVQEASDVRVVTSEEFRGRLCPKKRESEDRKCSSRSRHSGGRVGSG